jgi:hypothetical protein
MSLILMPINVKAEAEKLRTMYLEDPRQSSFNALLLGETGTGKSYILRTARMPALVDSFDQGGTKCLRPEIESGKVLADTRYEAEDPKKPFAFTLWNDVFKQRLRDDFFSNLGTYMLDSSTSWSEAIMNSILKKAGIAGEPPRWAHDYDPQKIIIRNHLNVLLNLPCDFILTGHLEADKDEATGKIRMRYMIVGKGTVLFPLKFDEIYVMDPKETSKGTEYRLLTQTTGHHLAASRLGRGGIFDMYEKPNIKALLKKAGLPHQDKPLFF